MGAFERRLKAKIKRDMKAEEKQAKLDEGIAASNRKLENNILRLEQFNEQQEDNITKYRKKAKEAQLNNNKAVFNSYVTQIINMQKLLDSNTLMMVDAIRHADNQKINRDMMVAQSAIGELVDPKLDITDKDMFATRLKATENAINLTNALSRDEQFVSMFDDIYAGEDSATDKKLFQSLADDITAEAIHEEGAFLEGSVIGSGSDLDMLKEAMRRERLNLAHMREKK